VGNTSLEFQDWVVACFHSVAWQLASYKPLVVFTDSKTFGSPIFITYVALILSLLYASPRLFHLFAIEQNI
jgi:hypothetical protein